MSSGNKPPVNKASRVAIKTLVNFAAKTGSLDRRFTPAPSGQEGIEGHKKVGSKRHTDYQTEVSLKMLYKDVLFSGRADGYDPHKHCIEEIKTFYGDVERIPENHRELHWAQLKCYGWLYCHEHDCEEINLCVIYFELNKEKEYPQIQRWSAIDLKAYVEKLMEYYCVWDKQLQERQQQLHHWLEKLSFPYAHMHESQRVMAEAVYKAAVIGRVVLAEAPTGTGKTLGTIFPALKAIPRTSVDKIFYLTAKTTGKQLALDNIAFILDTQQTNVSLKINIPKIKVPLRVLELTAQEKSCLQPDKQCRGDSCLYALDFYTKLISVREAAADIPILDKAALNGLAEQYQICPFYLSMEMARWVDLVVADVNYYFNGTPLLLGLTQEFELHPYLLVDESHNLIERGKSMYTAELSRSLMLSARKIAPAPIKASLNKIHKAWLELRRSVVDDDYVRLETLPETLGMTLVNFTNSYSKFVQENPDHPVQESTVQEFFFAVLQYQTIAEIVDADFCIDLTLTKEKKKENQKEREDERLTLRNIIPARQLAARLAQAQSACFFSATLHPGHYYKSLLGLPIDTVEIQVPTLFSSQQFSVKIAAELSTRYKDRIHAIAPLADIVLQQLMDTPGNAMVFFSSHEFLQQAEAQLRMRLEGTHIQLMVQSRRMSEQDKDAFVSQFHKQNNLLGLAVLGGVFSEGIDLVGDALKGAFIATLGLPQLNPINEYTKQLMQEKFGQGYDFTYTYPGIQKIIQAAGRVIRTTNDQGYLWLLDQRFQHPNVKALLPEWWFTVEECV